MIYRLPEMVDEDILKAYVQEHQENGEVTISASENVASEDYAHWVEKIHDNAQKGNGEWGKTGLSSAALKTICPPRRLSGKTAENF